MSQLRALARLSAFLVSVCLALPFACLARSLGVLGGRWGAMTALRAGVFFQTLWARASLVCMGIRLDLDGEPPRGQFVVVANHVTYLDVLVLARIFPGRFVAKSEIASWPVLGLLPRVVGTIFIERGRSRDVVRVSEAMRETLDAGLSVLIFPEGGTSRGLEVGRFHSALFESPARLELPCLPVSLGYSTPGSASGPDETISWWGPISLGRHLWRCLGLRRIVARVRWAPEPLLDNERKRLAERARAEVQANFKPMALESHAVQAGIEASTS